MNISFISKFLISVFFVITVLLNNTAYVEVIHNNIFSVNYLNTVLGSGSKQNEIDIAPPNHQRAVLWLSQKSNSEGDYGKARMIIESTGNVDEPLTRSTLGKVLINQGDVFGGVKLLVEVEDLASLHQIAGLAKENGRLDDSLAIYRELSAFHNKDGQVQYEIAQILSSQGKYFEANDWYRKAIDIEPHKNWYIEWVNNAEKTNDLVLVANIYEDMLIKYPQSLQSYLNLALIYKELNRPADSVRIINSLNKLNPTRVKYYIEAAEIYEWAGEHILAVNSYELALALDPDNKVAQRGLSRLSK